MWPFTKKISANVPTTKQQVEFLIKSLTLPEAQPRWSLYPQQQKWNTATAIEEGYNASTIVYTAVEKRAKLLASVPWYAGTKDNEGNIERLPMSHPLNQLIENPNRDQSWYELMYGASQQLDLSGNGFISEIRGGVRNEPIELWLLPTRYMKIAPGRENLVAYYEYSNGTTTRRIENEDMVQLRLPNPDDPIFGQPVLMAAGRATDIDRESADWQKSSLQNRGVLDLHMAMPEGTTQEQIEAVREALKKRQSGPSNAREPMVSNAKVEQLGQTAVEMDFINSRRSVWTEIAAAFGVPLAAMGFTEDVNLANAKEMDKQLWKNTIIPNLELLRRQLTKQLASEFGDNVVMMYDLSGISALQESFTDKLNNADKLFKMGYPANVINETLELNLPEIEGGDIGYIPTGLIPTGLDSQIDEDIDEELDAKSLSILKKLTYGE
jgi:HK97 family phage portal protein